VDAAQASSVNNSGLCEFVIEHSVRNAGAANAGSFRTAWTNEAVAGNWNRVWSPIAAGATSSAKELLPLKPGINFLQLLVDDLQQVQESNKTNNSHRVRIDVTGKCGPVK
jgi:subtilase family serine protease